MKRLKFLLLALIPACITMSGCFFKVNKITTAEETMEPIEIDLVSSLKLNLQGTKQKTLYPTIRTNKAAKYTFVYSSSDSSIATVTQSGAVKAIKEGTCKITVSLAESKRSTATCTVTVVNELVSYDYTIMYYMCGSDLEYDSSSDKPNYPGLLSDDIQEILSVNNLPDSVRIIIETGGAYKWTLPSSYLEGASKISSSHLQRWEVNNSTQKLKLIEELSYNEMAKQSSFEEFLQWGLDDYQADQMGVIISGHGGGIAGCAYDDNYTYKYGKDYYQHTLRTYEVARATKNALSNSSKEKFTWIGYDCCLMQDADIASINADYFDYMVGSQESENGLGWKQNEWISYLATNSKISPTALLPKICDSFINNAHSASEEKKCLQTLSVLDLSKMSNFIDAFNDYTANIGTSSASYSKVASAFTYSYNSFGESCYGLCDFKTLVNALKSEFPSVDYTDIKSAINELVIYNKYCSNYSISPCGVNAFVPKSMNSEYPLQVGKEDYSNTMSTKFANWQSMCVSYGSFGWNSI